MPWGTKGFLRGEPSPPRWGLSSQKSLGPTRHGRRFRRFRVNRRRFRKARCAGPAYLYALIITPLVRRPALLDHVAGGVERYAKRKRSRAASGLEKAQVADLDDVQVACFSRLRRERPWIGALRISKDREARKPKIRLNPGKLARGLEVAVGWGIGEEKKCWKFPVRCLARRVRRKPPSITARQIESCLVHSLGRANQVVPIGKKGRKRQRAQAHDPQPAGRSELLDSA